MGEVQLYPCRLVKVHTWRVGSDKGLPLVEFKRDLCRGTWREMDHARPFVGVFQKAICNRLSTFDNNSPQNGSKNEEMAPRTRTGCPHEGHSVARQAGGVGVWTCIEPKIYTCCRILGGRVLL